MQIGLNIVGTQKLWW